jgi:hypothetical protein
MPFSVPNLLVSLVLWLACHHSLESEDFKSLLYLDRL